MNSKFSIMSYLNISDSCLINQKLTKKTLLESVVLKAPLKKMVREAINEMFIVASFTPETANISSFVDAEYFFDEVHLFHVTLKKKESAAKVAELLQSVIPYYLIIFLQYENQFCFNVADKRINQVDKTKRVLAKSVVTEWLPQDNDKLTKFLDSIAYNKLSHINLKAFYEDVTARVYNLETSFITGEYQVKSTEKTSDDVIILREIKKITSEIVSIKREYKKEINYNSKLKLNVSIKKLEQQLQILKQSMKT